MVKLMVEVKMVMKRLRKDGGGVVSVVVVIVT